MQVDLYKMVVVIVLVAYHNKIYFTYCVINIISPDVYFNLASIHF